MDVTAKIARFVAGLQYEAIPPQALASAKAAALDCLGVALAGSRDECAKIAAQIARQEDAKQETTVFGQGFKSSALQASFANGVAAHALDFDHSFTIMGQPTAPIIPAIFSLGESLGAGGRQMIEAYAAGFETTAKLVFALRDSTQDGWHAPGTLGALGAAAGCAKLLRLDAREVEMALGITASLAGGVVCNFGTMSKPLHVGAAARNGVLAAKLAQSGYTANARAIEAREGFCATFYHMAPNDGPLEELGRSYALVTEGIRIKPYPCGGLTHQAIDAVLGLRAKHGLTADAVEAIDVDVTQHTYNRIAFRVPENGIQGKFCMGYLLARAIIDGKVSLDAFTDAAVRDPAVLKLAEKIHMKLDPSLKASNEGGRPCRVTVRLKNGGTYSREVQHAKGSPEVPMTADERKEKFTACARQVLDEASTRRALETIEGLETLADIRPLCRLLMG
ncbi:MAG TPA: MmgE/PrpD family protein [Candidatus Binatia bacterium]